MTRRAYTITLIPGDGIGQEVVPAAERLLRETGLPLEMHYAEAGWDTFQKVGKSVPDETLERVKASDATLAGAFTSPSGSQKVPGFQGAIRYLRRTLDLFANLRPTKSRPIPGSMKNVDMLMVRENTQGLYVEQERRYGDVAIADCVITKGASERIAKVALKEAQRRRRKLAVIHKANVLPLTTGLFLETALEAAKAFPEVETYDIIVDAAAMKLVRDPQSFDVLVTTNLFGDILSDLMAGLVGGLGLAPSANIGERTAIFEPVHGSAPDIAGKGVANPAATFLTAAMMLDYLGEAATAKRIDRAVDTVLEEGPRTADLGGKADTEEFTDAVIEAFRSLAPHEAA
ncbi:isocitrate/isopropylmalate dehydrogenase family protein [Truepera radiovictrix]|uniref:Isocitrate/homoisocitrate dehydrogenase n=1 Tax=Truepera radiovictrix (strain DSM 17093 / CIP 108686 / LMG 22925 / RQ-24) TaxID=649638 RepID=D7CVN0_TRURR|nr:isocitrate/isopropylmalate dehydrogenase family protein [Truepera radiovictrix]ADI15941.1 3-isopropylmalate dehydrogenase [Truepera radiovictrix DSM 17093]WMT58433.1 isocitrate/isopropylmalate dehydrogenase family protein [Truepera radiovictrix]